MDNRVRTSISGGIADVRLVRAEKMNARDPSMFNALTQSLAQLAGAEGLRAVVLSGEGRAFCAGLDMGSFRGMSGNGSEGANTPSARTALPTSFSTLCGVGANCRFR